MGKRTAFSMYGLLIAGYSYGGKNECWFHTIHKFDLKLIIDINVEVKTIKLLEDNIGENLCVLRIRFPRDDTKGAKHKQKTNRLCFIKINKFCLLKYIIQKIKG